VGWSSRWPSRAGDRRRRLDFYAVSPANESLQAEAVARLPSPARIGAGQTAAKPRPRWMPPRTRTALDEAASRCQRAEAELRAMDGGYKARREVRPHTPGPHRPAQSGQGVTPSRSVLKHPRPVCRARPKKRYGLSSDVPVSSTKTPVTTQLPGPAH
jgi:hypothetical protein